MDIKEKVKLKTKGDFIEVALTIKDKVVVSLSTKIGPKKRGLVFTELSEDELTSLISSLSNIRSMWWVRKQETEELRKQDIVVNSDE